jgi:hypothetical protein
MLLATILIAVIVALIGPRARSEAEERRSDIAASAWTGHVHP